MMKYTVKYSTLFKKSFKKCIKRGYDIEKFKKVISILGETGSLPKEYKPHPLKQNYKGCMDVTLLLIGYLYGNKMTTN